MTFSSSLVIFGLLLAASSLFPVPAAGHQEEGRPAGAVFTVRDTRDISTFEQLAIFTRRALAPLAPTNVTPLQAYGLAQACDDRLLRHSPLRGHQYGPAALVEAAGIEEAQAWYFRTPYEAISTARVIGWCDEQVDQAPRRDRYFATTYPIGDVDGLDGFIGPERRFMSMEAGRIDEYLRELEQRNTSDSAQRDDGDTPDSR